VFLLALAPRSKMLVKASNSSLKIISTKTLFLLNLVIQMKLERYIPKGPIARYVSSIDYIEGNTIGTGLPKTGMSMVFNLADPFKLYSDASFDQFELYKKYWIAGFQMHARHVENFGQSKMIVIQFKTLGAFAFFKEPLHLFTDNYLELDLLEKKGVDEVWSKLNESCTNEEKFQIAEDFLMCNLQGGKARNIKLIDLAGQILMSEPDASVAAVCDEFKISRKHLNHLFKKNLGVSPKSLHILSRFRRSLELLTASKSTNLTSQAYKLQYFDQAHFSKEFKKLAGMQPSSYAKLMDTTPSLKSVPHYIPKK